ncbi:hypothetical protein ACJZ2D_011406 [Fusarium nematophilum]
MQDSLEDWTVEPHTMTEAYSNAALTIVAAHAKNVTEGLFSPRLPKGTMAPIVGCSWGAGATPEPRAWTVQERFLSTRTLYFTRNQIFYRCATHDVCESFPAGDRQWQLVDKTSLESIKSSHDPRDMWTAAAGGYSRVALTKNTDKVVAIAGIAAKLRPLLQDE